MAHILPTISDVVALPQGIKSIGDGVQVIRGQACVDVERHCWDCCAIWSGISLPGGDCWYWGGVSCLCSDGMTGYEIVGTKSLAPRSLGLLV